MLLFGRQIQIMAVVRCFLSLTMLVGFSKIASAEEESYDYIKLNSYNGVYGQVPTSAQVQIGDVISLSADILRYGGTCTSPDGCPWNLPIEDFVWSVDYLSSCDPNNPAVSATQDLPPSSAKHDETCDPADKNTSCLDHSRFEVNNYGVNFYVTKDMRCGARISVNYRGSESTDQILLTLPTQVETVLPTQAITSAEEYPADVDFTPDNALYAMGKWVYLSGTRYWVPYTYAANWAPYQNGYWIWDATQGNVWVSYDPWGWYTDHYGTWRHHQDYGWIWAPFPKPAYSPCTVTWFYGDGYIGWYPYYPNPNYSVGYAQGYIDGFDDGYWAGSSAAISALYASSSSYYGGITVINQNNFISTNIVNVTVQQTQVNQYFHFSIKNKYTGWYLGGATPGASRDWYRHRTGKDVFVGNVHFNHIGKNKFGITDAGINTGRPIPAIYRDLAGVHRSDLVRPLGSIVQGDHKGPVVIAPTKNHFGIVKSPRYQDQSGNVFVKGPRTDSPAVLNPNNPIHHPGQVKADDKPFKHDSGKPGPDKNVRPGNGKPSGPGHPGQHWKPGPDNGGGRPGDGKPGPGNDGVRPGDGKPVPGNGGGRPGDVRPGPGNGGGRPGDGKPGPGNGGGRPDVKPDPGQGGGNHPGPGGGRPGDVRPGPGNGGGRPGDGKPGPGNGGGRPDVKPNPGQGGGNHPGPGGGRPGDGKPGPGNGGGRPDVKPNPGQGGGNHPGPAGGRPDGKPNPGMGGVRPAPPSGGGGNPGHGGGRPDVKPNPGMGGVRPAPPSGGGGNPGHGGGRPDVKPNPGHGGGDRPAPGGGRPGGGDRPGGGGRPGGRK